MSTTRVVEIATNGPLEGSDAQSALRSASMYAGKVICGPMVRISNLGFRSFAVSHGADVVFTEEIVAAKLRRCHREVRHYDELGRDVVEYVLLEPFRKRLKRTIVFSTYPRNRTPAAAIGTAATHDDPGAPPPSWPPEILQLGVADGPTGAAAALLCCDDVDGFDINMGCPKSFSVDNHMGAALMSHPERAASIITCINDAVNSKEQVERRGGRVVPISFKTRVMGEARETVDFLTAIMDGVTAGGAASVVHAITLHARTRSQSSDTPPLYDVAQATVELARRERPDLFSRVAFVFNGSVSGRGEAAHLLRSLRFDGVMLARHAMWNPTVFAPVSPNGSENGAVPLFTSPESSMEQHLSVFRDLLLCHARHGTPYMHVKYHLTRSFPHFPASKHLMPKLQLAKSYGECATVLGLPSEVAQRYQGITWEEFAVDGTSAQAEVHRADVGEASVPPAGESEASPPSMGADKGAAAQHRGRSNEPSDAVSGGPLKVARV